MRKRAGKLMIALTLLALLLVPIVVAMTHGPAAASEAASIAAHGHSHVGMDQSGGHDATDHEHQLSAILPPPVIALPYPARIQRQIEHKSNGPDRSDGPRRPPRV